MRIGINPEKLNVKQLRHKMHRVIIPVYIPNLEDDYFKNSLDVLKVCLDSLLSTINLEQTNITIINNNSCEEVDRVLSHYYEEKAIQKYIKYNENRGKVEPVLSEAMASYEEYVTISDADVLFRPGWLEATFDIFNSYSKAGVVAPLPTPNLYAYFNSACIVENCFLYKIKFDSVVKVDTLKEFEASIGSSLLKKYYNKQFYLEQNRQKAVLGAGHFVATYKNIFHLTHKEKKVTNVFESGLEEEYMDILMEKAGLFRLSTCDAFVYHMGNTVHINQIIKHSPKIEIINSNTFRVVLLNQITYAIQKFVARIILKFYKVR